MSLGFVGESFIGTGFDYGSVLVGIVFSMLFAYLGFRILYAILLHITKHTKISLDEMLVRRSHRPILFFILLLSIYVATKDYHDYDVFGITFNSILAICFISVGTYWAVRMGNTAIDWYSAEIAPKTKTRFDDKFAPSIKKYLSFGLILIGALLILTFLGVEITPLIAGLGIGGLAVALALQDTLKNFFSGVHVVGDKILEPGDWVKIDNVEGEVQEIGWRSTRIATLEGNLYVVPNSKITESVVLNYSKPAPESTITLEYQAVYGVDIKAVKELLLETSKKILEKDELYVKNTAKVRMAAMKDSGIEFKVFFKYRDITNRYDTVEKINIAVYEAFKKKKIEIPYPTHKVYIER